MEQYIFKLLSSLKRNVTRKRTKQSGRWGLDTAKLLVSKRKTLGYYYSAQRIYLKQKGFHVSDYSTDFF